MYINFLLPTNRRNQFFKYKSFKKNTLIGFYELEIQQLHLLSIYNPILCIKIKCVLNVSSKNVRKNSSGVMMVMVLCPCTGKI